MKEKLKKFKSYASSLLPYETEFLLSRIKTRDSEKSSILEIVSYNSIHIDYSKEYDLSIDKRKYSGLMHWMQQQLLKIDDDKQLDWITGVQQDILLDKISSEQETRILKSLRQFKPSHYYFINYYEMLKVYRHYLLIRMRYGDHSRINDFINTYRFNYQKSRLVNDQMHQATVDIIGENDSLSKSGIQWEKWMIECFDDDTLDGLNRYMSLVRLTFIYSRYKMLDKLEQLFNKASMLFKDGQYYSRRLLLNYYDNLVILHDKKGDYEKARYYGYLSVRDFNPDSIIYINNLVNVLLKMRLFQEALDVLESTNFKVRYSKNFHSMIGFISYYVRVLSKVGRSREAILKARVFLNAYDKQILKYRWYRFFSVYLGALLIEEKYNELLKLISKYKLLNREKEHYTQERSSRIIGIYYHISSLIKAQISQTEFNEFVAEHLDGKSNSEYLDLELIEMLNNLRTK